MTKSCKKPSQGRFFNYACLQLMIADIKLSLNKHIYYYTLIITKVNLFTPHDSMQYLKLLER